MHIDKPYVSRLTVVLNSDQRMKLESLAARRFAKRTSATFLYALDLADVILSHPATIRSESPEQAVAAFIEAQVGKSTVESGVTDDQTR